MLRRGVTRAVFESPRRCHRNLHQCLIVAGIETVLVNPFCSRRFAEALGLLAKDDCVDADMPELGTFGCRQAPSLLGLTPYDRDSGQNVGGRGIRSWRVYPRRVLYMAALTADRYRRLTDRGKPHKVTMVAVMRRLARRLHTLLR